MSDLHGHEADVRAPSIGLLGIEPLRAACEFLGMKLMSRDKLASGDGHPVIFFPGLASDRHALAPLRDCCESQGYAVHDWEHGFNTGPRGDVEAWFEKLAAQVRRLSDEYESAVSLIGWSLGGIYAREVAKLAPQQTRVVITLGTPFAGTGEETNVSWLYRLLNGSRPVVDEDMVRRLRTNPAVPTTSIFSRSDGVVAWQTCLLQEGPIAENVEVEGSHCGLGWNAAVLRVVTDRLAQRVGDWRPYAATAGARRTAGAWSN
jgi:hypothetical protein